MADIAITNITFSSALRATTIQLGEAAPAFDVVYQHTDKKYWLADATDPLKAVAAYILMSGGSADDYVLAMAINGSMNLTGPTLIVGTQYVLSTTGGKIAPKSDLLTGNILTNLFLAGSASVADFRLDVTGIVMP